MKVYTLGIFSVNIDITEECFSCITMPAKQASFPKEWKHNIYNNKKKIIFYFPSYLYLNFCSLHFLPLFFLIPTFHHLFFPFLSLSIWKYSKCKKKKILYCTIMTIDYIIILFSAISLKHLHLTVIHWQKPRFM